MKIHPAMHMCNEIFFIDIQQQHVTTADCCYKLTHNSNICVIKIQYSENVCTTKSN